MSSTTPSLVDSIFEDTKPSSGTTTTTTTRGQRKSAGTVEEPTPSIFTTKIELPKEHSYPVLRNKKRKPTVSAGPVPPPLDSNGEGIRNNNNGSTADGPSTRKQKARKSSASDGSVDPESGDASVETPPVFGPSLPSESNTGNTSSTTDSNDVVNARTVFVGNLPLSYNTHRKALHKLFDDCGPIASTRIRSVAIDSNNADTAHLFKLPPSHAGQQRVVQKIGCNANQLNTSAKQSVHGYVVFVKQESVELALQKNNLAVSSSLEAIEGGGDDPAPKTTGMRHIRVDRVVRSSASSSTQQTTAATQSTTHDASRSVFVGNLPYTADEESLAQHFIATMNKSSTSTTTTTTPTKKRSKKSANEDNYGTMIEGVRIIRDKDTQLCKGFGYILFVDKSLVATALQTCHETLYLSKHKLRVQVCGKRTKNSQGSTTQPKATLRRQAALANSVGAAQRVLTKQLTAKVATAAALSKSNPTKTLRKRGGVSSMASASASKSVPHKKSSSSGSWGVSKRAVSESKTNKRIKKIEKRISKGMGKKS